MKQAAVALLTGFVCCAGAQAADPPYPTRPVRLVVPFPPGGGTDITARAIAQHLSAAFAQNVVVDNRPGGNTVIGTELAARAQPDGHTLLIQINNLTALPAFYPPGKAPVSLADFAPVTLMSIVPHVLVVHRSVPVNSIKELVAAAKAAPGKYTHGSAGVGTPVHLAAEWFASAAGVQLVHVPYKGAADYMTAIVGGHVTMVFGSVPSLLPHIRSGAIRALGTTTAKRAKEIPDVPAIAEAGFPGFDMASWYGMFAPAKTPAAIVERLARETAAGLKTKAVADRMSEFELIGNTPAEFAVFLRRDAEVSAKIIRATGAKAD